MFTLIFRIVLLALLALFAYDYFQTREAAICAHNSLLEHAQGK